MTGRLRAVPFVKRQRYRLEAFGLGLLASIVRLLPYSWLAPLAGALARPVFFCDRARREVTLANLRCAFGDRYDEPAYRVIARKSFAVFARTALELLWSPNLTPAVMARIGSQENVDPSNPHAESGRSVLYACLHAGTFEWTGNISSLLFGPVPLVAQEFKNPLLGPLFDGWRTSMGHTLFARRGAMLRTLRHLKSGGKFGMLIDLNVKPSEGAVLIRCFGRYLTPVTPLPGEMALRTGAMVVPVEIIPRPEGGHLLRYLPAVPVGTDSTPASIAQACWDALEPGLSKRPELWLWSYKHWRYRPRGAEGDAYPFYANPSPSFDDLLAASGEKKTDDTDEAKD